MGKKNDKRANTIKLPKRVAGVKLAKPLRKRANRMIAAINNPLAAEFAAVAVIAAATALKNNERVRAAASGARDKVVGGASSLGGAIAASTRRMGDAYNELGASGSSGSGKATKPRKH